MHKFPAFSADRADRADSWVASRYAGPLLGLAILVHAFVILFEQPGHRDTAALQYFSEKLFTASPSETAFWAKGRTFARSFSRWSALLGLWPFEKQYFMAGLDLDSLLDQTAIVDPNWGGLALGWDVAALHNSWISTTTDRL